MISAIVSQLVINAAAFLVAGYFLPGFTVSGSITAFIALVLVFTLINIILKPLIKLVLSPLILITFGLFKLVIDGGILYIVDKYSENISISGLVTLFYATLIVAGFQFFFGGTRKMFKHHKE